MRVLTRINGWSGHLARLPATSPQARALKFRNEEWWPHTQELGNSWDPLNKSGWRHSRPGRFSRWEHQLTRVLHNWAQTALGRSTWRLTLYTFLKTSLDLLGTRNCTKELFRTPAEAPGTTVAVPEPVYYWLLLSPCSPWFWCVSLGGFFQQTLSQDPYGVPWGQP